MAAICIGLNMLTFVERTTAVRVIDKEHSKTNAKWTPYCYLLPTLINA